MPNENCNIISLVSPKRTDEDLLINNPLLDEHHISSKERRFNERIERRNGDAMYNGNDIRNENEFFINSPSSCDVIRHEPLSCSNCGRKETLSKIHPVVNKVQNYTNFPNYTTSSNEDSDCMSCTLNGVESSANQDNSDLTTNHFNSCGDAHLKIFLLEQISITTRGNNSNYYASTLRKALYNIGDKIVTTPEEAAKIKGIGQKTIYRFTNWLAEKGITFNRIDESNNQVNNNITQPDSIGSVENPSQEGENRAISRKRKRYSPKEGSLPFLVISLLGSYFKKHKDFPTKTQVVGMIRQRHVDKQKNTILQSIRSLIFNHGVIIEINGRIELTTEGWDVVGGKPSYLESRSGEVRRKVPIPAPQVVEVSTEIFSDGLPTESSPNLVTGTSTTFVESIDSYYKFYPIKISYVDEEGNAVQLKSQAKFKLKKSEFFYFVCLVFPLQREHDIRSKIDIDSKSEIHKAKGLGMLYGWIPDINIENSNDLGMHYFPIQGHLQESFHQNVGIIENGDELTCEKRHSSQRTDVYHLPCFQTDTTPPANALFQNPSLNTVTISHRKSRGRSRNVLMDIASKKCALTSIENLDSQPRRHTSTFNIIRYQDQDYQIILIVDQRERIGHNRNAFFSQVKNTIHSESYSLSLGDFIWVAKPLNGATVSSYVLDIISERKIADDLAHSIRDGRKKNQNFRMQKLGFSRIYYLIEGSLSSRSRFSPLSLSQAITNMAIRDRFIVTETNSDVETMNFLYNITSSLIDEIKKKGLHSLLLVEKGNVVKLHQFAEMGSKDNCKLFPEILGRQLYNLKNCSRDAALAIISKYPNVLDLYQAFEKEPTQAAREELIRKTVTIPSQGHLPEEQIPKKVSKHICDLFTLESYGVCTNPK